MTSPEISITDQEAKSNNCINSSMTISNNSSRGVALDGPQAVIASPRENNLNEEICKNLTFDVNDTTFKEFLNKNREFIINYYLSSLSSSLHEDEREILNFLQTIWKNKKNENINYNIPSSFSKKNKNSEIFSEEEEDDEKEEVKGNRGNFYSLRKYINSNKFSTNYYSNKKKNNKTSNKEITKCPHKDRKHYAKNMCRNCYHSKGRLKKAWKCEHKDTRLYAKGLCQNCYYSSYKMNNPEIIRKAAMKARIKQRGVKDSKEKKEKKKEKCKIEK